MTGPAWKSVAIAATLLAPTEREAVLGDLIECGESAWQGLCDVCGLVIRREISLFRSWRPWVASCIATYASFMLMGLSVSICLRWNLLAMLELSLGGWAAGYTVARISRPTLWASMIGTFIPCLLCLSSFRVPSLSRYCLLLFLIPALYGAVKGAKCHSVSSR